MSESAPSQVRYCERGTAVPSAVTAATWHCMHYRDYSTRTHHTGRRGNNLTIQSGVWGVRCGDGGANTGIHELASRYSNDEQRTTNEGLGAQYVHSTERCPHCQLYTVMTVTADSNTCPLDLDLNLDLQPAMPVQPPSGRRGSEERRLGVQYSGRDANSGDRDSEHDSHKPRSTSIACPKYVLRGSSAAGRERREGGQEGGDGKEEDDLQFYG